MQNIEIAVNLEYPKVATEEDLLTSQVHHLRECFDRYMQQKTLSSAEKSSKPLLQTRCVLMSAVLHSLLCAHRGKGRLLSLS